jgi:hypothetical protein
MDEDKVNPGRELQLLAKSLVEVGMLIPAVLSGRLVALPFYSKVSLLELITVEGQLVFLMFEQKAGYDINNLGSKAAIRTR